MIVSWNICILIVVISIIYNFILRIYQLRHFQEHLWAFQISYLIMISISWFRKYQDQGNSYEVTLALFFLMLKNLLFCSCS